MNDNLTEIICILDQSGSMHTIQDDTLGGFNAFLEKQRDLDGEAKVTLTLFDTNYEIVHDGVDIQEVPELDGDTYHASGSTALLDAMGRTIDEVGNRLASTDESERPGQVLVVVVTDGQENSSKEYTLDAIKERVEHQQDKYDWEFVFLGANIDSFATAGSMGFAAGSMSNYSPDSVGTNEVWSKVNRAASTYRAKNTKGDVDAELSDEDKLDY